MRERERERERERDCKVARVTASIRSVLTARLICLPDERDPLLHSPRSLAPSLAICMGKASSKVQSAEKKMLPHTVHPAPPLPETDDEEDIKANPIRADPIKDFVLTSGPEGPLAGVAGLAFDHDCNLYVVECYAARVQVFASDGEWLYTFRGREGDPLRFPLGIAIDDERQHIIIADTRNCKMRVFSIEGTERFQFGSPGRLLGEFYEQERVVVDSRHDGRLVIADSETYRVQVFNADGTFRFAFGSEGSLPGQFQKGIAVAVNSDGDIIVADSRNHRVQVFTESGQFLWEFGSLGKEPGHFDRPLGICVDADDRIIVADVNNSRLQAFTNEGKYLSSFDCGFQPYQVTTDRRGRIAFSGHTIENVVVIGAGKWLPLVWTPDHHHLVSENTKSVVETMTMIRSLEPSLVVSLLPNELLFEIFFFL